MLCTRISSIITVPPPLGKHIKLGGEWELIVQEDSTILIACTHGEDRWVLDIGFCSFEDPEELEEGINYVRTKGESTQRPH